MKKRFLSLLLLLLLLMGGAQILTSCQSRRGDGSSDSSSTVAPHTHEFGMGWAHDDQAHWHTCHVTGCAVISARSAHRYGEDGSACLVCGRSRKGSASAELLGSRTASTWTLSATEENALVYTERDSLGRILTRTHYRILDSVGDLSVGARSKLREEIFTYRDGKLLFSETYTYESKLHELIPLSETAELSYTTHYEYDEAGRLERTAVKNARGVETGSYDAFHYDEHGALTGLSRYDAELLTQTVELNEWGEPTRITTPSGKDLRYTYDGEGNLLTLIDGDKVHTLSRQSNGDLTVALSDPTPGISRSTTYTVDRQDRLITAVTRTEDEEQTTDYTYDESSRLTEAICSVGDTREPLLTLSREYGDRGQLLRETVTGTSDEDTVLSTLSLYEYTAEGVLTRISRTTTENGVPLENRYLLLHYHDGNLIRTESETETVSYDYTEEGVLLRKTVSADGAVRILTLNEMGNPVSMSCTEADGTSLSYTFEKVRYDYRFLREFASDSRPVEYHATRIESTDAVTERSFDPRRCLTEETITSADGKSVTESTFSYDEQDRLLREERICTTLDDGGRVTDTEQIYLEYGSDGALLKESRFDGTSTPTLTLEYRKGANGSYLYRKTEYASDGEMTVTLYNEEGEETVTRYDSNGTPISTEDVE